mgnify:CR=1 FL=1
MDPGQLTDINSMRVLSSVYDTLVRFKEGSFTREPGLATSWKMSPDGLTYTFTLRKGVKFHDGTPFDAEAVKFTYDRLLDPKHPNAETGPFPFASFYYGAIKEVTVVDPATVRFTVKQPFSPLLNNLTLNTGRIVSPAAVKKFGKEFASHPVGTGPFRVRLLGQERQDRARGECWLLGRSAQAGGDRVPTPGGRADPRHRTHVGRRGFHRRRAAGQRGPGQEGRAADLLRAAGPAHLVGHAQHREEAVQRRAGATGREPRGEPGRASPRRSAEAHRHRRHRADPAVDHVGLHRPGDEVSVRPGRAKKLLAEAGYPNGFPAVFWIPESGSGMQSPKTMAQSIQADLAAVGVTASIQTFEWGAYLSKYGKGFGQDADMGAMSFMLDPGDPAPMLSLVIDGKGGFRGGAYANPEVDALLAEASADHGSQETG